MSKVDRKNGVPSTLTTIPLADPHAGPGQPSIGDLIKDATTQVSTLVRAEVELARAEITRDDVTHWAIHPGGPRVLECAGDALGLGREELDGSRRVLAEHGNCSSATILVVIDQIASRCAVGDVIVALTFGPGLTLYGCVLRAVPVVSPA